MPTPALVRNSVPMVVGALLAFLTSHNIAVAESTEALLVAGLTAVFGAVYHAVVSLLETRWPLAGILLGSTARPTYAGKHRMASISPATATSDAPEDKL